METWSYHLRMGTGAILQHSTLSSDGCIGSPGIFNNIPDKDRGVISIYSPANCRYPGEKYRQDSYLDTEVVFLLEKMKPHCRKVFYNAKHKCEPFFITKPENAPILKSGIDRDTVI